MSLELCILASGSAGNCSVLRSPAGTLLIDLGLGPRNTARRLAGTSVHLADVAAVCLTHLDADHFNRNWIPTLVRQNIRVYCHADRARDLLYAAPVDYIPLLEPLITPFDSDPFSPLDHLTLTPLPLAHDREGSHGFVIDGFDYRIGYATDLGHVPDHLLAAFSELDCIAIESNYDPVMQQASPRPPFLKRRITGGRGHLSNQQALAAIQQIFDRAQAAHAPLPDHIVLLHRSRQCNCPKLLRRLFESDPRIAPRLTLSDQSDRTPWLRRRHIAPAKGEQLLLAWT